MVRFIQTKGTHLEMGIQQAEQLPLKQMVKKLMESDMIGEVKPKLLPIFILKFALGLLGRINTKKYIKKYLPNQLERMKGISKGSGIGMGLSYGINFIEVYTGNPKTTTHIVPACTMLFGLPPATADGSVIFARNYDFPAALQPYQVVRKDEPDGKYKSLSITQWPLVGAHMGVNEKGLAVAINYARTWEKYPDDFSYKGVPPTLLAQEMLENFATTEEALEFITTFPARSNAQFYGIIDKSGDACVAETTHSRFAVRRPEDGIMVHSNTYRTEKFLDVNCPMDHHWRLPSMQHIAYIKSPMMRYDRAFELISKIKGNITMESFQEILNDHNYPTTHPEKNDGVGNDFTVCNHGKTGVTLASIIVRPQKGQIFVTDTQPCQMMYEEFNL